MTTLKLDDAEVFTSSDYHPVLCALKTKCPVLRSLDILDFRSEQNSFAGELLCALEGKLYTLFASGYQASIIAENDRRLRHLNLLEEPSSFRDLVYAVGPPLESFEIHFINSGIKPEMEPEVLVKEFCPKLTSIKFREVPPWHGKGYADVLCSFGSQLRFACLDDLPKAFCAQVVSCCPNMLCSAVLSCDDAAQILLVLGPCIQNLTWEMPPSFPILLTPPQACWNVEEIEQTINTKRAAETVRILLSVQQSPLTKFILRLQDAGNADDALKELSEHARPLLYFRIEGFAENVSSFTVGYFDRSVHRYDETVEDIICSVGHCSDLRELTIEGRRSEHRLDSIADMSCPLRHKKRQMTVEIDRVTYIG